MIPPSYVDNFYDDPDPIVNTAWGLKYHGPKSDENFAGFRTDCISSINYEFFSFSVNRFLSCFFEIQSDTRWKASVNFHKNYCHDQYNPHHPFNLGWVHVDDVEQFRTIAGVIYLNKNTYPNSGTSIYNLNGDYDDSFEWGLRSFNRGTSEDEHLYTNLHFNHNKQFDLAVEFKNRYNRMVAYDGHEWHSQSCLWVPGECRLTQLFFINFISDIPPLKRYHPSSLQS
tara:strand:+ start:216 stop:896 length:681 start_codon:yes stop_codon:yes gene_type:complete